MEKPDINLINKEPSNGTLEPIFECYKDNDFQSVLVQAIYLLEEFPNSIVLRQLCGVCHVKLQNLDAAIENYQGILAITPNDIETLLNLADIYNVKDDRDSMILTYESIKKIDPFNQIAQEKLTLFAEKNLFR